MDFIWNFLFYSLVGFVLEITYARLMTKSRAGRKCLLFLPLCPVYGMSVALILLLPEPLLENPFALFLGGAFICTAVEYLFALFYERVWHVRFWDYSSLPFQLHGRVCLSFAFVWGFLVALFIPLLAGPVSALGRAVSPALLTGFFAAFLADWFFTGIVLRRSRDTMSLRWWQRGVSFP